MRRKGLALFTGLIVLSSFMIFIYSGKMKDTTTINMKDQLQPIKILQNGLNIMVDPRIELLSALQVNCYDDNTTTLNLEYKNKMYERFLDYSAHKTVTTYEAMAANGYSYDAPPASMLYYSYPLTFNKTKEIDHTLAARAGGEKALENFMSGLRAYALDTDFAKFYGENKAFYKKMVDDTASAVKELDMVNKLETYYGEKQNSYSIILAPMFNGGYGPRVKADNKKYDIYGIVGPGDVKNGMPYYDKRSLRHIVLHEFGHSFVNHLTKAHYNETNKSIKLFDRIKSKMEAQAYGKWEICINEHIVRAVVARITLDEQGEHEYQNIIGYEKSKSFAYIEEICKKLEVYEKNREKYNTIEEFYPELLQTLEQLANRKLSDDFYKSKFTGTINSVFVMGNPVVFVVPTNEKNKTVQAAIHKDVDRVKGNFPVFKDAEIITDKEALKRKLGDSTVVAYGTMHGNLWLERYKGTFPFRISKEFVTVDGDKEYKSKGLKVITALPNPNNPYNAIVIYTAQDAVDIPGINNVFHGPTGYVVAKGQEVIKSGEYSNWNPW